MSMSKKDYVAIAAAIHRSGMALNIGRKAKAETLGNERALRLVAGDLAATLAADNPAFDKARFLAACGVTS